MLAPSPVCFGRHADSGLARIVCGKRLCFWLFFHVPMQGLRRGPSTKMLCHQGPQKLWAAGQMTLPEQLAAAMQRHVLDSPLQHNRGVADPPNLTVVPPDLVGEPVPPTMDERAIHVTLWVAAVFYEAETVDIEMPAPLSLPGMKEALRGACSVIPDSLDEFHPTVPQLGDYYGSFVAQPVWLRNTNRITLLLDARTMGGTVFAFYQEGRVNLGPTIA